MQAYLRISGTPLLLRKLRNLLVLLLFSVLVEHFDVYLFAIHVTYFLTFLDFCLQIYASNDLLMEIFVTPAA